MRMIACGDYFRILPSGPWVMQTKHRWQRRRALVASRCSYCLQPVQPGEEVFRDIDRVAFGEPPFGELSSQPVHARHVEVVDDPIHVETLTNGDVYVFDLDRVVGCWRLRNGRMVDLHPQRSERWTRGLAARALEVA